VVTNSLGRIRVWDMPVRVFHWSLVSCFAVAYLTAEIHVENSDISTGLDSLHQLAGYAALGLIGFRVIWGFVGSIHARFTDFVQRPSRLFAYLRLLMRGYEPRYLGHNPAAAVMILFLMIMTTLIGGSGYLLTTDYGWSSEALEEIHEIFTNCMLVAIAFHVAAAIYESWKHRENLILSMITGYKRSE